MFPTHPALKSQLAFLNWHPEHEAESAETLARQGTKEQDGWHETKNQISALPGFARCFCRQRVGREMPAVSRDTP